jgi:hypothetical protein
MKPWITTHVYNSCEQKILIQPTPALDGIEIYIQELDGDSSGALYINEEELPIIIKKLQEMMNYVTND